MNGQVYVLNMLYNRFLTAPVNWLNSPIGRHSVADFMRIVRNQCSRANARDLRNRLTAAGTWPGCDWLGDATRKDGVS